MAILRAEQTAGKVKVKVTAMGLKEVEVNLSVQ
jgi:hypothetical protein